MTALKLEPLKAIAIVVAVVVTVLSLFFCADERAARRFQP